MTVSPVGPEHKNCRATKHHWTVVRYFQTHSRLTISLTLLRFPLLLVL